MKKWRAIYLSLAIILFVVLLYIIPVVVFDSLYILENKQLPFLVTRQLAIDSIGMLFKGENYTKVLPLTYIKEVNGVEVKKKDELLKLVNELSSKYDKVTIKFSSPFFGEEKLYEADVNLYHITLLDYTLSILVPLVVGFLILLLSLFLALDLIWNYRSYTDYKIKKLFGSLILFLDMYLMIVTGLDLVLKSRFYYLLYLSFAFSGLAVSLFFYYSTYLTYAFQRYINYINFAVGFIFVTLYLTFWGRPQYLLTVVKINYIYTFINTLVGFIYIVFVTIKLDNEIEKSRLKLLILLFTSVVVVLGLVFFIQGLSLPTIPVSVILVSLGVISPGMYFIVRDHNVEKSRRRVSFSIVISILLFSLIYITSIFYQNLSQEGFIMMGIYLIPSVLFIIMTIWYLEENIDLSHNKVDIDLSKTVKNIEKSIEENLKIICPSITYVKTLFQYPLTFVSESMSNLNIDINDYQKIVSLGDGIISLNDSIYLKKFEIVKHIFETYKVNYIIKMFTKDNRGFTVLIRAKNAINDLDVRNIMLYLNVASVEISSLATINTVKITKVLSFEFEILRQSQINMLTSKKEIRMHTPKGDLVIRNFWDPMSKIAGDIFGTQMAGEYLTSWVSDICGKGLTAAALSFSCYSMISHILKDKINILDTTKTLNEIMSSESIFYVDSFFITLSGVTFNLKTLEAELVNCGNPPILFYKDSDVTEINPKGSVIGVFDDQVIESSTINLRKGDMLLLLSDGITDIVKKENVIDGIDVLKSMLKTYSDPYIFWKNLVDYVNDSKKNKDVIDDITVTFIYLE